MEDYEIKVSMFADGELPEEELAEFFRFLSENEEARKMLCDYLEIKKRARIYYAEMNADTGNAKIIGSILPSGKEKKKYKIPFYISAAAAVLLAFLLWSNISQSANEIGKYKELQTEYILLQKEFINSLNEKMELVKLNKNLSSEIENITIRKAGVEKKPHPKKRKSKSKKKPPHRAERKFTRRNAFAANVPVFTITKDDFLGPQIVGN